MVANAVEAGGAAEVTKLVESLSETSGIPAETIVAKMRAHLIIGHSKAMH
jgi:hypothetical protein